MVIDWKENVNQCLKTKKLVPIFHASSLEQRLQQTFVVKMLLEQGKTYVQIKDWFKKARPDDPVENIAELIVSAHKKTWPKEKDYHVYITENEINNINSMPFDKEFKSFILSMVYLVKIMKIKKGCTAFNVRDRSYAYYLGMGTDDYRYGKKRVNHITGCLHEAIAQNSFSFKILTSRIRRPGTKFVKIINNIVLDCDWIEYGSTEGYLILRPEQQLHQLCRKVLTDNYAICPVCGKKFVKSSKQKTDLCKKCYTLERKKKQNIAKKNYHRKVRNSKNIDEIETN